MSRILCPDCGGTQVAMVEEVLADCGRCLGHGWVVGPPEPIALDVRFWRDAAIVLAFSTVLLFAVLVVRW